MKQAQTLYGHLDRVLVTPDNLYRQVRKVDLSEGYTDEKDYDDCGGAGCHDGSERSSGG